MMVMMMMMYPTITSPVSSFCPLKSNFNPSHFLLFSVSSQNLAPLLSLENLETFCAPATPLQPCRMEAAHFPSLTFNEPGSCLGILPTFLFYKT